MLVRRTPKGQEELRARDRTLGLRERGLLFLADGTRTLAGLDGALGPDTHALVQALVGSGYLALVPPEGQQAAPRPPAPAPVPTPAPHAVDTLKGGRSLAGMRMYLFDVCERTFARGAPDKAMRYREHLREARDAQSMLAVAREMLDDVEALAGEQRARSLREKIEALMPDEGTT